ELAALHRAILTQDPALRPDPVPRRRSQWPARTNLPTPITELVGRDTTLDETRALLRSSRLVTLTGPGGVGKTRLAVAAAEDFDGLGLAEGAWLVELAGLAPHAAGGTSATDVAELVAAVVG